MNPTAWNPKRSVELRNGASVEVTEMDWKHAVQFLQLVSGKAGDLLAFAPGADPSVRQKTILSGISNLVKDVDELGSYLLANAVTNFDPTEYGVADTLKVLTAALELNLSEDVIGEVGRMGKAVGAVFGATTTATTTIPTPPSPQ